MSIKEKLKTKVNRLDSLSADLWNIVDNKAAGTESNSKLLFELGKLSAQIRIAVSDIEMTLAEWEK